MPTTSKVVSVIKPFLLGFVVAVMLIALAAFSSIYALCKDHRPIDVRFPDKANFDFGTANALGNPCSSFKSQDLGRGTDINGGIERDDQPPKRRKKLSFLSIFASKKKKAQRAQNISSHNREEKEVPPPPQDSRVCFCRFVWESLGYRVESKNTCSGNEYSLIESTEPRLTEEQQREQRLKAIHQFPTAFTPEIPNLIPQQQRLVEKMRNGVLEFVVDFEKRSSIVPWGGPPQAFAPVSFDWYSKKTKHRGPSSPLDQIDGGNLFSSYLRIMKWPEDLERTHFPFKLCKARKKNEGKDCEASVAIQHSLEFRERYMPWLVTPGIKRANSRGLVYHRGFSPPHPEGEDSGHAIVWLRLALKNKTENENERVYFVRSMIREFDRAVAASLQRSNGRLGKFNAVVDGNGFTWSSMPSLSAVKTLVAILQDHFADRLGVVILVNVGSICELLLKLFLPLITEEVRNKIVMLPHDPEEQMETLQSVLGAKKNIPDWLGGTDNFNFEVEEYYANDVLGRDEEALEYLTTMPYHA